MRTSIRLARFPPPSPSFSHQTATATSILIVRLFINVDADGRVDCGVIKSDSLKCIVMNQTISPTILRNCRQRVEKTAVAMSLIGRHGSGRQVGVGIGPYHHRIVIEHTSLPVRSIIRSSPLATAVCRVEQSIGWTWAASWRPLSSQ